MVADKQRLGLPASLGKQETARRMGEPFFQSLTIVVRVRLSLSTPAEQRAHQAQSQQHDRRWLGNVDQIDIPQTAAAFE